MSRSPRHRDDPGDAALIGRLAAGDRGAVEELYDRWRHPAFELARRILGSGTLAEQVLLDVFVGLWRNPAALDAWGGRVASGLLGMVHRQAVDALRRENAHDLLATGPGECAQTDPAVSQVSGDDIGGEALGRRGVGRVGTAFLSLPPAQREALRLALFGGRTQPEVAVLTGTPLATIRKQLVAAVRQLIDALPDAAPGDRDAP